MQSLYIEANEPPLILRWEKLSLQYALKLQTSPNNPTHKKNKQTNNSPFHHFYSSKPLTIPPFGLCIKEAIQHINQNTNHISLLAMSNLPPWTITKLPIDLTLIQQEKTQPTISCTKNRFKELRDKYSDHINFYTDGSKTIDRTIAAATNINNYKQIRLPNITSIYSAEIQAIKVALDMIKNSEMGKTLNKYAGYDINQFDCEVPALVNVDYSVVYITLKFILTHSGSTC